MSLLRRIHGKGDLEVQGQQLLSPCRRKNASLVLQKSNVKAERDYIAPGPTTNRAYTMAMAFVCRACKIIIVPYDQET